jgi:WbqC-like protein family
VQATEESKPVLLSLGYVPPMNWFMAFAKQPIVWLEQHEHYTKGSYRNRCQIVAAGGPQRLTIPLRKGKNQQQPIREVRIAYDEPWQIRHWRAIVSAYSNSPFFEHYAERFQPFFLEKKYDLLWDWNYDLIMTTLSILRLKNQVCLTEKYEANPILFIDKREEIELQEHENQAFKYPQVFEDRLGFLGNMSILDLIFCAGRINI